MSGLVRFEPQLGTGLIDLVDADGAVAAMSIPAWLVDDRDALAALVLVAEAGGTKFLRRLRDGEVAFVNLDQGTIEAREIPA